MHDADWQYPAITEQHAYHRVRDILPEVEGWVYLAFPWATLIDLVWHGKNAEHLLRPLRTLAGRLEDGARVATVCQHIRALEHIDLILEVTSVRL